jgi:hypothetical protein
MLGLLVMALAAVGLAACLFVAWIGVGAARIQQGQDEARKADQQLPPPCNTVKGIVTDEMLERHRLRRYREHLEQHGVPKNRTRHC